MARNTDATILALAATRHGACSRKQLMEAGLSPDVLESRVHSGLLERVRPGLFLVPYLRGPLTELAVATLAVPGSAVARQSAARLHGFPIPGSELRIVGLSGSRTDAPLVRLHQSRYLPGHHIVQAQGLPLTSPARTLCDLAAEVSFRRLRYLVENQTAAAVPTMDELVVCFQQLARRGRNGIAAMRLLLDHLVDDQPVAESVLERKLDRALRQKGVRLRRQFRPPWYDGLRGVVDFADTAGKTIVEADGRSFHSTSEAFDNDRRRDRVAAKHGWVVLRIGWREVGGTNGPNPTGSIDELVEVVRARRFAASAA